MKRLKVHDKTFELYIEEAKIHASIEEVSKKITADYFDKNPIFIVVLNGAFMFAADLFKKLTFPCEVSFVKLSSYQGTQSTEVIRELIGLDENVEGRHVVVVEDIVDTGITIERMLEQLADLKVASVRVASMLFKPKAYLKKAKIDYVAIEIPNDFIIGYGLDYDGYARNLPDIYKVIDNND